MCLEDAEKARMGAGDACRHAPAATLHHRRRARITLPSQLRCSDTPGKSFLEMCLTQFCERTSWSQCAAENSKDFDEVQCSEIAEMVDDCLSWKGPCCGTAVVHMENGINNMKCMRALRGGTLTPVSPLCCLWITA